MEQNTKKKTNEGSYFCADILVLVGRKALDSTARRAWKGDDFSLLDQLKEEGLIDFSYTAKSLYLSEEGVENTKRLIERLEEIL